MYMANLKLYIIYVHMFVYIHDYEKTGPGRETGDY